MLRARMDTSQFQTGVQRHFGGIRMPSHRQLVLHPRAGLQRPSGLLTMSRPALQSKASYNRSAIPHFTECTVARSVEIDMDRRQQN